MAALAQPDRSERHRPRASYDWGSKLVSIFDQTLS